MPTSSTGCYGWIEAGRESARLTEVFHERNALLFEAKFREFDTYADYFKIFDARPTFFPVGNWEDQGEGYFSRLIVNPTGRVWAFFRCGDKECPYHSAEPGLQTVGDPAGMQWEVVLEPPAGLPVTVRIARPDRDRLTIEGRGQPSTMAETPPPIDPAPARRSLNFLGPFTALDCRGDYTDVRQLWLWQEGTRLYAVGCQRRREKGPPRRCKKGPLGGCGLVPVVHGRAPRATRRALNRLTRRRAREGPVGPRGQAWAGWSVQLAVGV